VTPNILSVIKAKERRKEIEQFKFLEEQRDF
jgi:hypothetical protein